MPIKLYKTFSYLDQFPDIEIDLTRYIEKFDEDFSNIQPVKTSYKNLFEQFHLIEDFLNRGATFEAFEIKEGQTVESVSAEKYGTIDLWWVVLLFNNIKNPFTEWVLKESQLVYLSDLLHEKENKFSKQGYYDILFNSNEQRRVINILKKEQVYELIDQFISTITNKEVNQTQTTSDNNFSIIL